MVANCYSLQQKASRACGASQPFLFLRSPLPIPVPTPAWLLCSLTARRRRDPAFRLLWVRKKRGNQGDQGGSSGLQVRRWWREGLESQGGQEAAGGGPPLAGQRAGSGAGSRVRLWGRRLGSGWSWRRRAERCLLSSCQVPGAVPGLWAARRGLDLRGWEVFFSLSKRLPTLWC